MMATRRRNLPRARWKKPIRAPLLRRSCSFCLSWERNLSRDENPYSASGDAFCRGWSLARPALTSGCGWMGWAARRAILGGDGGHHDHSGILRHCPGAAINPLPPKALDHGVLGVWCQGRAHRDQGLPDAAVGDVGGVGTSAGRSFVRRADTPHRTGDPGRDVTSNPIASRASAWQCGRPP
jgi:hypothetical protein